MSHIPDDEHLRVFSIDEPDEIELDDDLEADAREEKPSVTAVLESLRRGVIRPAELIGLSDLGVADVDLVRAGWSGLPLSSRMSTMREVAEMSEDRVDYHFGRFLRMALEDEEAGVRQLAVSGLWEDEGPDLPARLTELMESDESEDVRAQAALGLARFAELGELGRLAPDIVDDLRERLFVVALDDEQSWHVRRRAVEAAAAFASDARLVGLINQMFEEEEIGLRATAVFAMGRSMANRWLPAVINEFVSDDAEIRYEAARAGGLLADTSALPGLSELAQDDDLEVRLAAITSIGQIGGSAATRILRRLVEDAPETDEEAIDDALIEASIASDPLSLDAGSPTGGSS